MKRMTLNPVVTGGLLAMILLTCFSPLSAQQRVWVMLSDKGDLGPVTQWLSPAALRNRANQGLGLDLRDAPVSQTYLRELAASGAVVQYPSRWLNAVSVEASPEAIEEIRSLPFVKGIRPVALLRSLQSPLTLDCDTVGYLGTAQRQLGMLGLDQLHVAGFTGKGVRIAVFDNGYRRVDSLAGMAHLFEENRILHTWDFVDNEEAVFDSCVHCKHGTYVFSILAARQPGGLNGGAPDADYLLFRTEDDYGETHQEESNWIAAAERADSLGAQIFTTSLGYKDFDAGEGDYEHGDLDGNTALITIAADIAASRGILVVNSAGNNGNNGINAPADGDSVLAVGAVNECEEIAPFSSRGPSGDGRIKPDVVAMGQMAYYYDTDGSIRKGNGTSFSCPLMTSLAACLWQKHPALTAWELHQVLIQAGDRYETPDMVYGYGLPNAARVEQLLSGTELEPGKYAEFREGDLVVFPNPTKGYLRVAWLAPVSPANYTAELIDASGRRHMLQASGIGPKEWQLSIPLDLPAGLYVLSLSQSGAGNPAYVRKVVVE